jgi:hypothetical protein
MKQLSTRLKKNSCANTNKDEGDILYLYHYFDASIGPFKNLSDLNPEEAEQVLANIKEKRPDSQSAKRHPSYVQDRRYYETLLREDFTKKGGVIRRNVPHYMVVGHSPWLTTWYENSSFLKIPISEFDLTTVSFTYGDSHPVFSPRPNSMDGKEYRKKIYLYHEILVLIEKYGLPQTWNDNGKQGPERYIEAHVWSDEPVLQYCISK